MHAKPLFAYRLQTAKMASSRTSAQNNGPQAQHNDPWVQNNRPRVQNHRPRMKNNRSWVQSILLERKIFYTPSPLF